VAELKDGEYQEAGRSYLVCPRLLELDRRHRQHPDTWERSWRWSHLDRQTQGRPRTAEQEDAIPNPGYLYDPEGHLVTLLVWAPTCRPLNAEEWPHCDCGRALIHADLEHPGSEHEPGACPREDCRPAHGA
jgi:hypothetical protein